MVNTGRRDRQGNQVRKLQVVHDYNRFMGGVDRNDEMIANYNCSKEHEVDKESRRGGPSCSV